ncbi:MAG: DUF962 domain-containing protein [Flavobacterium sp.]|nr:DUF962 domain-containing protein [Flavobacterium sp.]
MRTLEQWFDEYSISHQNPINKLIHYICVPAIYFSVVGLLLTVKLTFLDLQMPIFENSAFLILIFVMIFYFILSASMAIKIAIFSVLCLLVNYQISLHFSLLVFSLLVFIIAWIGQFYGHKIEGKKPSFLKDLQFLMIGPAWVIENLFSK